MQAKQVLFKTVGMNLDLSESAFNPLFAFENRNIRLSAIDGNTLMSITNERGTKSIGDHITGTPIGYAVIDGKIVLFTTYRSLSSSSSNIYLITIDEYDNAEIELMYSGNLGFSTSYPIETLVSYENENAIKVYWTDGLNLPRVINIAEYLKDPDAFRQKKVDTLFDFVSTLLLNENCSVTRAELSSGTFSPGTVQYVCTYYNRYGGESNIFYASSIHYVSFDSRGGSPEERISNAFNIELSGLDKNFSYVRIYSIHRTSLDAVPTVRRVIDLEIKDSEESSEVINSSSNYVQFDSLPASALLNKGITTEQWQGRPLGWFCSTTGYFEDKEDADGTYREVPLYINLGGLSSFVTFMDLTYYCSTSKKQRTNWYFKIYYDNTFSLLNATAVRLVNKEGPHNIYWWTENIYNVRKVSYTDDGESGDTVDPTVLLYIGGKEISAGTMTLKDNTLFLGNIKSKGLLTSDTIKETIRGLGSSFIWENNKTIQEAKPIGVYPYINHLDKSLSEISTFKYGEYYRIGVQLLKSTGEWSEPLFIDDFLNNIVPQGSVTSATTYLTRGKLTLDSSIVSLLKQNYSRIRPMVVFPSYTDREVICQGVLNPTVYNVLDRGDNSPYALPSWFFRPNPPAVASSVLYSTNTYLLLALLRAIPKADTSITIHKDVVVMDSAYSIRPIGIIESLSGTPNVYLGIFEVLDGTHQQVIEDLKSLLSGDSAYLGSYSGSVFNSQCVHILGYNGVSVSDAVTSNSDNILYVDIAIAPLAEAVTINCTETFNSYDSSITNVLGPWSASIPVKTSSGDDPGVIDNIGSVVEFRHGYSLKPALSKSAELQCTMEQLNSPELGNTTKAKYCSKYSDLFFIDLSIVTLNSPDLEWDTNLNGINEDGVELKIVGYIPITGTVSDLDILTSTPALNYRAKEGNRRIVALGFYKEGVGVHNISPVGYKSLVTVNAWLDELFDESYSGDSNKGNYNSLNTTYGFPVYPWHRKGSMNNLSYNSTSNNKDETAPNNYRSAKLSKKKMSNLRTSYRSIFLPSNKQKQYKLSGLLVFNSDLQINTRLNSPVGEPINYYGNIDKLVTNLSLWYVKDDTVYSGSSIDSHATNFTGYRLASTDGYWPNLQHLMFLASPMYLKSTSLPLGALSATASSEIVAWKDCFGTDPIEMKYKSGIHAVLSLSASNEALPAIKILPDNGLNPADTSPIIPFWSGVRQSVSLDIIDVSIPYGYLWLADLVRTNVSNRFGGTSPDALQSNSWIPCGKEVSLDNPTVTLYWDEGDTYYQRYDCLKTYPFTLEDSNSIVDILSFMCETRVNIDGRYDRNRGLSSNLTMLPSNFNLINDVYTLKNNFFNYRMLDNELFNFEDFPHTITWTKTKSNGEKVDTWTNITLASTMDLDGDRGDVTKLVKFNDSILALQEKGISLILYNELMQLSTSLGVPIEISNSGKVTGKRYLSDRVGCRNKWSVAESPQGIYFVDDYGSSIQLFNGTLVNLSDTKGFYNWAKSNITLDVWNPSLFSNIVSYYDYNNRDVLFITSSDCLAFSEGLGLFSSFYSYENTPYFININEKGVWIKDLMNSSSPTFNVPYCLLWLHLKGLYNTFFGLYKSFSTTVLANPDFLYDKVFSTIDFRSDTWDNNNEYKPLSTFDTLETWNEYLHGKTTLVDKHGKPASLKKKFRVWRALIPRNNFKDSYDGEASENRITRVPRDRMRNPWIYLKLSKESPNTDKTVLHDIIVNYFV